MDSLLPQIAADLHTTIGLAAMVVTAYAVTHGSVQLLIGPLSDRFGKYRTVALTCAIGAVLAAICGTVTTLPQLAVARLATGAAAGWVIPISMAYNVWAGGRWRSGRPARLAQCVLCARRLFALSAAGLVLELAVNPQTRKFGTHTAKGFVGGYSAVLSNPFARVVIIAGFIEGALAWGAFAFIGAYLRLGFGLSFSLVGAIVACFGVGGLLFAGLVKLFVYRLGQTGLVIGGGLILAAAYVVLATASVWWLAPMATTAIGLGFYMLHNTLQTNATQMTPQARGTAAGLFSSAL
jgi:MFS transporter, YNFM family, putative membrane transport protein